MQVTPTDDLSDDVAHLTPTTSINREATPLIVTEPKKWFSFCRSVEITNSFSLILCVCVWAINDNLSGNFHGFLFNRLK